MSQKASLAIDVLKCTLIWFHMLILVQFTNEKCNCVQYNSSSSRCNICVYSKSHIVILCTFMKNNKIHSPCTVLKHWLCQWFANTITAGDRNYYFLWFQMTVGLALGRQATSMAPSPSPSPGNQTTLVTVDIVVLVVYFLLILAVGFWVSTGGGMTRSLI